MYTKDIRGVYKRGVYIRLKLGQISSLLNCNVHLRFRAINTVLVKIRPKRKTYRLRIKEGSKIILGRTNLTLRVYISKA